MKRKLINLIITGLLITLTVLSIFTYKSCNRNRIIQQNINNQRQEQTFRIIDKQTIINKLNLEDSLNCLSGNINTKVIFSNQSITNNDVNFKWLKTKLSEWNSKDISVDSEFNFTFSYNLKDIPIQIYNNSINIQLSCNRLSLTKCELSSIQSSERIGWLTNNFSPNEINSINFRVKQLANNTIQSDNELRQKAMNNVQEDIKSLLKGCIGNNTNIHFSISEYNTIQQNDVELIK